MERHARELEGVFAGVPGGTVGYWTGDAAVRFADAARRLDRGIAELAENCRLTARALRRSAESLRAIAMLPTA
ncbi:hypothetical protein [Acrocarpospora sp. B8E8]|uniref:hypothetical protein n=1 Tax=Acrocarpospora sp. B8E8 TaxID=3153572 RepID=UPI00325E540C